VHRLGCSSARPYTEAAMTPLRAWLALALLSGCNASLTLNKAALGSNPVAKVIVLLEDMTEQIEADGKAEEDAFKKMVCWCTESKKDKTLAIEEAKARITNLENEIEQGVATIARLGPEIDSLKKEAEKNDEAMKGAIAIREKQVKQYAQESKDLKDSISALKSAVAVMKKNEGTKEKKSEFIQMQAASFLQVSAASRMKAGLKKALAQHPRLLEQVLNSMGKGTDLLQAASEGSYEPSGEVLGMLTAMLDSFTANLEKIEKEEAANKESFEKLESAKGEEIGGGASQTQTKIKEKAAAEEKLAHDKKDLQQTKDTMEADQKYLAQVNIACANVDEEWDNRQKTRREEVKAVAQAIKILSAQGKPSFLQISSSKSSVQQQKAASKLAAAGSKFQSSELSLLALRARADGLAEVKAAVEKMIADLKKKKEAERTTRDKCVADLNENKLNTQKAEQEVEDVEIQLAATKEKMEKATAEKEEIEAEVKKMEKELMKAAADREAENKAFQTSVKDQRDAQEMLKAALKVLSGYYSGDEEEEEDKSFLQLEQDAEPEENKDEEKKEEKKEEKEEKVKLDKPDGFSDYKKSSASKGVLGMLELIIKGAEESEAEAIKDENDSQKEYEKIVKSTSENIEAKNKEVKEKKGVMSKAEGEISDSKTELANAVKALANFKTEAGTLASKCTFLIKNYEGRQEAISDEVGALIEAKGIMGGLSAPGGDEKEEKKEEKED